MAEQPTHQKNVDSYHYVRESLRQAGTGITPILVNNWRHQWMGVGSAFVVTYGDNVYLLTAKHVLDCAFQHKQVMAKLFGVPVFLHGLYFVSEPTLDLSVTLLPWHWLDSYGIRTIYAPRLEPLQKNYLSSGNFELVGFPASKNKVDTKWPKKVPISMYSFSAKLIELTNRNLCTSKIANAIYLNFDPSVYQATPPALQGMSGGPLFEVMTRKMSNDCVGISLVPRGVLCEWHKRHRTVVASNIGAVIDLITDRSAIWRLAGDFHAMSVPAIWPSDIDVDKTYRINT